MIAASGAVIETVWRQGGVFQEWGEHFRVDLWTEAMAAHGLDMDWYVHRHRTEDEVLPWDHLSAGLHRDFLWQDWRDALEELGLPDCRWTPCYDCGACTGYSIEHVVASATPPAGGSQGIAEMADVGRPAVRSAQPTVAELTKTTEKAPELANNLEIVLRDLDDRGRAVEKDKRSPGGQGYTGFEAVLSYIFDQMMAINIFDENGHILKINLSVSECSEYQNADSLRRKEKETPGFLKRCLAGLGPNQPGVTTADPTDTGVDDPGHEPQTQSRSRSKKKGKRRAARKPEQKSENAPGQPDLKKALDRLLGGGGGTNKPVPAVPNVTLPQVPQVPKVPGVPNINLDPGGSGGQSADPKALLDYLLGP